MQVALDQQDQRVIAWETERGGRFKCQLCHQEAIIKKGNVRAHHFAHKIKAKCHCGEGESDIHYNCKKAIYEALKKNDIVQQVELEAIIGKNRSDVLFKSNNEWIAIEVQKSNISIDKINRKMKEYDKHNVYVLWIIPFEIHGIEMDEKEGVEIIKLKQWQRYLHYMYYGRLYYWVKDLKLMPYHFTALQRWVEEVEVKGEIYGGYYKSLKTKKIPDPYGYYIDIINDFIFQNRKEFQTHYHYVPKCKIIIDDCPIWWKQ